MKRGPEETLENPKRQRTVTLFEAAGNGDVAVINELISKGVDVNLANKTTWLL